MENRNLRKERVGVVKSNKMNKSVTVTIQRKEKHSMYGKFLKKSSSFVAHDEKNTCSIGDKVSIMETRPMSKRKCWRLVEIIENGSSQKDFYEYIVISPGIDISKCKIKKYLSKNESKIITDLDLFFEPQQGKLQAHQKTLSSLLKARYLRKSFFLS